MLMGQGEIRGRLYRSYSPLLASKLCVQEDPDGQKCLGWRQTAQGQKLVLFP